MADLEVNGLFKDFGSHNVLNGVNLHVPAGERHAIIGPNGSGKTTLINTITGELKPSRGSIRFGSVDLVALAPHELVRHGVARSFQIISVFPELTTFANMRNAILGRRRIQFDCWRDLEGRNDVTEEADELLATIGLSEFRNMRAGEMSYGKQRTLDLGLAIAQEANLIILDEPTAGISTAETEGVTELIARLTENKTLILVEHDMDVVFAIADRVSVLCQGEILAQGTPEAVRNDPDVKSAYLGFKEDDDDA